MKYRCDNCGSTAKPQIPWANFTELCGDLVDRLDPGGEVPAGECKCGALTYLVKVEPKPKVLLVIRKGALEAAHANTEVELLLLDHDCIDDVAVANINRHYLQTGLDAIHTDTEFETELKRQIQQAVDRAKRLEDA